MKKRIAFCLFVFVLFTAMFSGSAKAIESGNYRTARGTFTEKYYWEDSDSCSMIIETEDGNVWRVDNYVFRLLAECEVTFDTMGTEDVLDDEIIEVTTKTIF